MHLSTSSLTTHESTTSTKRPNKSSSHTNNLRLHNHFHTHIFPSLTLNSLTFTSLSVAIENKRGNCKHKGATPTQPSFQKLAVSPLHSFHDTLFCNRRGSKSRRSSCNLLYSDHESLTFKLSTKDQSHTCGLE